MYATNVLAWEIMVDRRGRLIKREGEFFFFSSRADAD